MHPEADALLDAIFDHPDDDTPRLVYADWLQEHGQEDYAQFIRLQCAAARHPLWSDEANDLWVQIGRFWNRLAEEWWPATTDHWSGIQMPMYSGSTCLDATHFHRGFLLPHVAVTAEQFLRYRLCWPQIPLAISTVEVRSDDDIPLLARLPDLRRVSVIRSEHEAGQGDAGEWSYPTSAHLDLLLLSSRLRRIRELDLSTLRLSRSTAELLIGLPNLASIEYLEVLVDVGGECDPDEVGRRLRVRFPHVVCHREFPEKHW